MRRLGILGSTAGTDMIALINAIQQKKLAATIEIVISNKKEALILEKARQYQLPEKFINPENLSRDEYDEKLTDLLQQKQVDYVLLIGYMRILTKKFVAHWHNKIINVHPSLLPLFGGAMDKSVHQAVLEAGVKVTGCTIHFVTDDIDAGPIILQKECPVYSDDTVESLKVRVQKLEGEALIEAIGALEK